MKKESFRSNFYILRVERQGLYALLAIIAVVWIASVAYLYMVGDSKIEVEKLQKLESEWVSLDSIAAAERKRRYRSSYNARKKYPKSKRSYDDQDNRAANTRRIRQKTKAQVFAFDPNTISVDSLQLLGFPQWLAKNIEKYRSAGGSFKKPEDLFRIRAIDSSRVTTLLPYMTIKPRTAKRPDRKKPAQKLEPAVVEIDFIDMNKADAYQWMLLPGIGETKAAIIIEQRDRLGGFADKDQLMEVWGINDSLYWQIEPQLLMDTPIYRKLQINTADVEGLAWHKYVTYKKAKILCAYRRHHGPYTKVDDLRSIIAFSDDYVDQLAPYLDFATE